MRGTMASGFAFDDGDGFTVSKGPKPGGQLSLKSMPRNTKTAIFHTRQATQGSIFDNENNHPIISPGREIAMIHNGIVWNDGDLRATTLNGLDLPEVDSAVIAPLIQLGGIKGLAELSGDVAIAWLERDSSNILNLARVESNPIAYTWLMDGSFVFASTVRILATALEESGLDYGFIFEMDEGVGYRVMNGVIIHAFDTPDLAEYDWRSNYSYVSSMREITAGGSVSNPGSENKVGFANVWDEETQTWEFEEYSPSFEEQIEAEYEQHYNTAMALLNDSGRAEYYTIDEAGDIRTYASLDALETELIWYAGLNKGDDDHYSHKSKDTRWVEFFVDVGSFEMDGKSMLSWIDQPSEIYNHEDPDGEGLSYIRDGVNLLVAEIGR